MLKIIFEDNHLLVLLKPPHLPTQPTPQSSESLETLGKMWLKEKYKKTGNVFLHAIHRLDGPVSGVVVFAKTSKALSRLQASMRASQTEKTYLAWVEGKLEGSATLEDYLVHGDHNALLGKPSDKGAKKCRLSYTVLEQQKGKTLIKVHLETGRYHQIRAQFGFRGHPIIGDKKYGSRVTASSIALYHVAFSIPHPITGATMTFEAPTEEFLQFFPLGDEGRNGGHGRKDRL